MNRKIITTEAIEDTEKEKALKTLNFVLSVDVEARQILKKLSPN